MENHVYCVSNSIFVLKCGWLFANFIHKEEVVELKTFTFLYSCIYVGAPARTVGWRDPGYTHTSFLKELWPNRQYVISYLRIIIIACMTTDIINLLF